MIRGHPVDLLATGVLALFVVGAAVSGRWLSSAGIWKRRSGARRPSRGQGRPDGRC